MFDAPSSRHQSARQRRIKGPHRPRQKGDAAVLIRPADFADDESQRVLTIAARAVAGELGRQAAREYFAEAMGLGKVRE